MLMPALSVTLVGLVVGLVIGLRRGPLGRTLLWSVLGAWIGFAGGAFVGVVVDVLARSGEGVLVLGHLAAAAGAVAAGNRLPRSADQPTPPPR